MGDAGTPSGRFQRALQTGNLFLIETAALELPHVGLRDSLVIVTLMAEKSDPRFEKAAAKWLAQVSAERRLSLADVRRVGALLDALPAAPQAVAAALRPYCNSAGLGAGGRG